MFARYENGVEVRYFYWSMFETMDVCERLKLFCVRRSSLRTFVNLINVSRNFKIMLTDWGQNCAIFMFNDCFQQIKPVSSFRKTLFDMLIEILRPCILIYLLELNKSYFSLQNHQ